ncbi:hypothetical protein OCT63_21120 [Vibrio sp. RW]|uniref:hypothetical protein n=1 Tax=Vibrio sp. RW TaxID=2998833 RepID=UPI0022CD7359|nr:hypothetical protein [Vibrio sp. RW]MDA0146717.1 hypothetical protein [Vibrio sp. RW]
MSKSDIEKKKQQFEILKMQFEVALKAKFDSKDELTQVATDLADVVLTTWHLEEDTDMRWADESWFKGL